MAENEKCEDCESYEAEVKELTERIEELEARIKLLEKAIDDKVYDVRQSLDELLDAI